jgi:methylmalonyl-CoA mutase
VIRATEEEKKYQIEMIKQLHKTHADKTPALLEDLKHAAVKNQNLFEKLMEVAKYCSIGQITDSLYNVGGQYRRNM